MILSIRDCAADKVELNEAPDASLIGPPRCDALILLFRLATRTALGKT